MQEVISKLGTLYDEMAKMQADAKIATFDKQLLDF